MALASNMKQIGAVSVVKIDEERLRDFNLEYQLGKTPAVEINERHRNITGLNYVNMSGIIRAVLDSLSNGCMVRRGKPYMRKLLVNAYKDHKLDVNLMSKELLEEIENLIERE